MGIGEIATARATMETAPPVAPTLAAARAAETLTLGAAGLLLAAAAATDAVPVISEVPSPHPQ